MMSVLVVGFLLGMRHALEADHVAAVASLVSSERSTRKSILLGALWGLGHASALFAVVTLVLLFGHDVPVDMAHILEMIVGVMLMLLGVDVLLRLYRERIHFHAHSHQDGKTPHFHAHRHQGEESDVHTSHDHTHDMSLRALAVGLVHGLAGSAVLIVLTAAASNTHMQGMAYAALFGVGSILGMTALSIIIAVPMKVWGRKLSVVHNRFTAVIGITTIAVGGNLLVSTAVGSGLFVRT